MPVKGHIEDNGQTNSSFNGLLAATVRDTRELITCKRNFPAEADQAFQFYDRTKTLYNGNDSVRNGMFTLTFAVPMDINYSDGTGLMNLYAVSNDRSAIANGYSEDFKINGSDSIANDSIGPSIYCYLNSPSFVNGGDVNSTPYFVANITDRNGINASGTGIGHDMQLIIDGDMSKTYNLNSNFAFDFGSYTSGTTFYSIPELEPGHHQLLFRAWDILNNPNTATLDFNVVKGLGRAYEYQRYQQPRVDDNDVHRAAQLRQGQRGCHHRRLRHERTYIVAEQYQRCVERKHLHRGLGPDGQQRRKARHGSLPLSCAAGLRRQQESVESQETDCRKQ